MPRPTKLTEQLITNIALGVQRGARPEVVAQAYGVGRSTYYGWVDHGRKPGPGDQLHVMLVEEIDRARGIARLYLIDKIAKSNDWRAAAKLLEILDPDWARAAGAPGVEGEGGRQAPTIQIVVTEKTPARSVAPDNATLVPASDNEEEPHA